MRVAGQWQCSEVSCDAKVWTTPHSRDWCTRRPLCGTSPRDPSLWQACDAAHLICRAAIISNSCSQAAVLSTTTHSAEFRFTELRCVNRCSVLMKCGGGGGGAPPPP